MWGRAATGSRGCDAAPSRAASPERSGSERVPTSGASAALPAEPLSMHGALPAGTQKSQTETG